MFGPMLRKARVARRLTQEQLADDAEISTRHLSCLEGGKAKPSREMVLVLASALDLPLRERNLLLNAAGYVAAYSTDVLDAARMAPIRNVLAVMLDHQEPYPAFVFDTAWNVVMANRGAGVLLGFLLPTVPDPRMHGSLVHALYHPEGLRQYVVNWDAVASHGLERLQRDLAARPDDDRLRAAVDAALSYANPPKRQEHELPLDPFLPLHVRKGDIDIKLFTMLTTVGTPLDVTAQELTIESYYPADAASAAAFKALSG